MLPLTMVLGYATSVPSLAMAQYGQNHGYQPPSSAPFVNWADHAVVWVGDRWRGIVGVVVVVLLLVGVSLWWQQRTDARADVASSLLYQISKEQLGQEAALKTIVEKYPTTVDGALAQLQLGALAVKEERWKDAVAVLQPLAAADHPDLIRSIALESLAYAYERGQEFANAAATFQDVLKIKHGVARDSALRGAVRCLLAAGQTEQARTVWETSDPEIVGKEAQERELLWMAASSSAP